MDEVEEMAGAILDGLDADPGVKEFKRTVQHDDGTSEMFRVDVTEIGEGRFVAASVRQRGERRRESGPKEFSRGDRRGFAAWLAGDEAPAP
jgi:hypothetical protein